MTETIVMKVCFNDRTITYYTFIVAYKAKTTSRSSSLLSQLRLFSVLFCCLFLVLVSALGVSSVFPHSLLYSCLFLSTISSSRQSITVWSLSMKYLLWKNGPWRLSTLTSYFRRWRSPLPMMQMSWITQPLHLVSLHCQRQSDTDDTSSSHFFFFLLSYSCTWECVPAAASRRVFTIISVL